MQKLRELLLSLIAAAAAGDDTARVRRLYGDCLEEARSMRDQAYLAGSKDEPLREQLWKSS